MATIVKKLKVLFDFLRLPSDGFVSRLTQIHDKMAGNPAFPNSPEVKSGPYSDGSLCRGFGSRQRAIYMGGRVTGSDSDLRQQLLDAGGQILARHFKLPGTF